VDLLLVIGGDAAGKTQTSRISIREASPTGSVAATSTATLPPYSAGARVTVRFDLSVPIALKPGTPYLVEWVTPGPSILVWMGSQENPYPGGNLFGFGGQPVTESDLVFTTYFGK
jgi:hypothetical protein